MFAATQQFAALFRITQVNGGTAAFTEDLQDSESPAFQALAQDVENTVRNFITHRIYGRTLFRTD